MARTSTKKQEVLEFVTQFIAQNQYPPSVREICEATGIKSTSTVHYYLKELVDEGYIVKDDLKKRTIKLPGVSNFAVPLLGTVTAGIPITAIEEIEEYIPVPNLHGSPDDYFALHVRGESMKNAGI